MYVPHQPPSQLLLACVGISLRVKSDRPSLAWIESPLNLTLKFTLVWCNLYNLWSDSTVTLMAYDLTTDPMYKIEHFCKKWLQKLGQKLQGFFFKQAETGTSVRQCNPFNKHFICARSSDRLSSACKVVVRHVASIADPTGTTQVSFFFLRRFEVGGQQWKKYIHIPNTQLNHSVLNHWRKKRRGGRLATVGHKSGVLLARYAVWVSGVVKSERWLDCFYSSSLACLITKLCRLSMSRPPWCSSPCSPALNMIKVG